MPDSTVAPDRPATPTSGNGESDPQQRGDTNSAADVSGNIEALRIALANANAALAEGNEDGGHDALALLVETVERIHPTMRSRAQRLRTLIDHYQPDRQVEHAASGYAGEAFALVSRECANGHTGTRITTHASFEAACANAGDDVLNGWAPVALFGLDSGEMVLLVVEPPTVYLSPHRQTMQNPLDDDH